MLEVQKLYLLIFKKKTQLPNWPVPAYTADLKIQL